MDTMIFDNKLVSVPFSEYGGPIKQNKTTSEEELLDFVKYLRSDLGADFVQFSGCDLNHNDIRTRQSAVTFHINISREEDAVWDHVRSNFRQDVRKARREGVKVVRADSIEDLRKYYHLYLKTMRGHGSPPHSLNFLRTMWKKFDNDQFRLYLAKKDGKCINGRIVLRFGNRVIDRMSVADIEYRSLNGGSLLLWEAISEASSDGYEVFDLGRTRRGTGVYTYKKKLNGEEIELTDSFLISDNQIPSLDPEEDYQTLQKYWRKLPLPVVKTIGPHIRKGIDV
jgi:lipid II:glycine glycyltransferase (peptidoglycan interpeptide bridge formation enzyme)